MGPLELKEEALALNLIVRQENNGSLEDLAALIDEEIPPLVLGIAGGGENATLDNYLARSEEARWLVVTGYARDEMGSISHVYFNDPAKREPQCWSAWHFLTKFWDNNTIPGGHRYYMALAKRGSTQENSLKTLLPNDKISISFDSFLRAVDELETRSTAAEQSSFRTWFA